MNNMHNIIAKINSDLDKNKKIINSINQSMKIQSRKRKRMEDDFIDSIKHKENNRITLKIHILNLYLIVILLILYLFLL